MGHKAIAPYLGESTVCLVRQAPSLIPFSVDATHPLCTGDRDSLNQNGELPSKFQAPFDLFVNATFAPNGHTTSLGVSDRKRT